MTIPISSLGTSSFISTRISHHESKVDSLNKPIEHQIDYEMRAHKDQFPYYGWMHIYWTFEDASSWGIRGCGGTLITSMHVLTKLTIDTWFGSINRHNFPLFRRVD